MLVCSVERFGGASVGGSVDGTGADGVLLSDGAGDRCRPGRCAFYAEGVGGRTGCGGELPSKSMRDVLLDLSPGHEAIPRTATRFDSTVTWTISTADPPRADRRPRPNFGIHSDRSSSMARIRKDKGEKARVVASSSSTKRKNVARDVLRKNVIALGGTDADMDLVHDVGDGEQPLHGDGKQDVSRTLVFPS